MGQGARGSVLVLPGRTEYAEKYARVAVSLEAMGFGSLVVDFRGQGLSDRLLSDARPGHVEDFADYQHDVRSAVAVLDELAMPKPLFLLAHSMGGCIALRSLVSGLIRPQAAVFSAPMWGMLIPVLRRPTAWGVTLAARAFGQGHRLTPGVGGAEAYLIAAGFDDNLLTTDRESFDWMRAQVIAVPELGLGAPTLSWLNAALRETRALRRLPSPKTPALTLLGSREKVVDPAAVRSRMARWPGGRLELIAGAEHEIFMETPATRARAFALIEDLFSAAVKA
jgi:lysophospholipase